MESIIRFIIMISCLNSISPTVIAKNPPATTVNSPLSSELSEGKHQLALEHWAPFNQQRLNQLLQNPGSNNYAVFDFDNTSVFLDIGEALLIYQLENLKFALSPDQLNQVLHKNIPNTNFVSKYNNHNNQPVNIDKISQDIVTSYGWIYANYQAMQGSKSLAEIRKSDHYKNFISKVRYLYAAIGATFDHAVSYPWVTYLLSGMTAEQVAELTKQTINWQLSQPISEVIWQSPDSLSGKAGVVTISWKNGFRFVPEMQQLYQQLQAAGIDVYVCSASNYDIIKSLVTDPAYGFNVPTDKVYAMRLLYDAEGRLIADLDPAYPQTQGKGKTTTIKQFIAPHYAGKGPILVAGDSEGDQNMMADFADTQLVLIINRLRSADTIIGQLSSQAVAEFDKPQARILLQGRNENSGKFEPSQRSYLLGESEAKTLP